MKNAKKCYVAISVCILTCALFLVHIFYKKPVGQVENLTFRASLYPIVPDMENYENAVVASWNAEHPDIKLELVDWYCYSEDLPDDLDVFVFDGIFLSEYSEKGYLLPVPEEAVWDKDDFVPFAIDELMEDAHSMRFRSFCAHRFCIPERMIRSFQRFPISKHFTKK